MISEPKEANLLIHEMNKACYVVNAQYSTSQKARKNCIGHHLQNTASVTNSYTGMFIDLKKHKLAGHIGL